MLSQADIERAQHRLSTRHGYRKDPARLVVEAVSGGFGVFLRNQWFDGETWHTEEWPVGAQYDTREAAIAAFKGLGTDWRRVDDDLVQECAA